MSLSLLFQGIYIFTTVFALGVTAIESLGLLGDSDDGGADADHGDALDVHGGDEAGAADEASGEHGVAVRGNAWQQSRRSGQTLFAILGALRIAVYFCLGFGPMGLVAILFGASAIVSLLFAVGAGMVSAVLYRRLIRFQQKDLDSTVHDRDLIGERADVLIAIYPHEIGRVRIKLDQMVRDRYAVSDANEFIPKGARVEVLAVSDKGLVVAMPET
jgi:membrane protein implicated in regulation of membrane protease activity